MVETIEKKKRCGRKKKIPDDENERKKYIKEHYYHSVKKYQDNKRKEDKIQQLKKMYAFIKDSENFDDIKDELFEKIKLKNF